MLSDLPLAWRIGLADAAAALDQPPDPPVPGPSLTELCALAPDQSFTFSWTDGSWQLVGCAD